MSAMSSFFSDLQPSRYVSQWVPAALERRYPDQLEKALKVMDAIYAGRDEKALSQRNALSAFTIRVVSAFIAYVSQVLMARWLGSHEYGIFVWVWVAAVICGGLATIEGSVFGFGIRLGFRSEARVPLHVFAVRHSTAQSIL